ncbi:uncharacterized protein LOC581136 [Strongylocentrotus purpuratus]|uniref:N-acetyltransferase domain-containing protein n=1 Tax=Strongylocentrotus purpuratus TaxID=7668 RepID=A0A7M7PE69_STRPU|nr:uncharacterized protein LOC581136 [Strongylocentrotus purpuratus]
MACLPRGLTRLLAGKNIARLTRRCLSSTNYEGFKVRQLHGKESASLANSQTAEGSRLTNEDLKVFHSVDPNGFFVALDNAGDIVGTIGAVRWTEKLGFIGFCHAGEEAKDRGVEEALWLAAMEHLGDRNIGIEVDASEAEKCGQLGFQEEWRSGCYKGVGVSLLPEAQSTKIVRRITDMPFSKVAYFDEDLFDFQRMKFLYRWANIEPPAGHAYALSEDEKVMGYGVLRQLNLSKKYRIAPLYCQHTAVAQVLLLALLNNIPEQTVYIDSPFSNPSFTRILTTDLKMEQIGERVRMYTKGDPGMPLQKMFGTMGSDLGS